MRWFRRPTPQFTVINPQAPTPVQGSRERIPKDLWNKCEACGLVTLKKDFVENSHVCPKCNLHSRMDAMDRIDMLCDPDTFKEDNAGVLSSDPLGFEDTRKYAERYEQTRKKTGRNDAVITGKGDIGGVPTCLAVMDFSFMGGSMGSVVGEKISRAMERAIAENSPCITIAATGGARMQEGILSLMQLAKTSALCHRMAQARIPYISILTDPSTAGVMASFASLGDVIIAEPAALVGFAGRRVIEQTINQVLPPNFQTSEFVQAHGFIDLVVHRHQMRTTLIQLLRQFMGLPAWAGDPPAETA